MTTQPTPEAGADLLDRMAEALRNMCEINEIAFNLGFGRPDQDGPYPTSMKVLAEYDRLRASPSQEKAETDPDDPAVVALAANLVETDEPLTEHDERRIEHSWNVVNGRDCQRPPKGWFCTRERDHDGPCAASLIVHPTPEADAVAPVAIGQSDSIEMLAANIMTDCGLSDHGNDRLFQTIQARLYEYTRNRARPAPTVATREAVTCQGTGTPECHFRKAQRIIGDPRISVGMSAAAQQAPSGSDEGGVG